MLNIILITLAIYSFVIVMGWGITSIINLLYFNYHGFAAQILGQGCLIIAFLFLYLSEYKVKSNLTNYIIIIGLTVSALFTIYPEITPFLIIPSALYVAFILIKNNRNRINLIKKVGLIAVVTVLIDPLGFWYGFQYAWLASSQPVGWSMPRWSWPIDMVGLLNIHSDTTQSFWLFIASIPVISLLALGITQLKNKPFWLSILVFTLGILVWLRLFRHYSYGYYKTIGFSSFFIILTFASGLAAFTFESVIQKFKKPLFHYVIVSLFILINAIAVLPTFKQILINNLSVTPELVELSKLSSWVQEKKVFVEMNHHWDESWATIFLNQAGISTGLVNQNRGTRFFGHDYLFSEVEKGGLYITQNWHDGFINTDKLIWGNGIYSLIKSEQFNPESKTITVQIGENWWALERWMVESAKSQVFRWMNQDATLKIENKFSHQTPVRLTIKFIPILPKTTVNVYLNDSIIETIDMVDSPKIYSIDFLLRSGNNKVRFHVREGIVIPPGDHRKLALGANFIIIEQLDEAGLTPNLDKQHVFYKP
jgi:hypothetical protein